MTWFLVPPVLLILLVTRRWFSRGPQGPSRPIHGHLVSAILLWLLSWIVVFASHGRNAILLVVPPLWIIWITRVAYRSARSADAATALGRGATENVS